MFGVLVLDLCQLSIHKEVCYVNPIAKGPPVLALKISQILKEQQKNKQFLRINIARVFFS